MTDYKVIDDPRVVLFFRVSTDNKFKSTIGLKFPWFGKNKGKMLVPQGLWGKIAPIYLMNSGYLLPNGQKITAKHLTKV